MVRAPAESAEGKSGRDVDDEGGERGGKRHRTLVTGSDAEQNWRKLQVTKQMQHAKDMLHSRPPFGTFLGRSMENTLRAPFFI